MTSGIGLWVAIAVSVCCALPLGARAAEEGGWSRVEKELKVAVPQTTRYSIDGSHIEVTDGGALIEPVDTATLKTPHCQVSINQRSLVFVRVESGVDHIFVLLGKAKVHVGKHSASLGCGEEAIVADHEPTYKEMVADEIGRRRVRFNKLSDKTIAITEFSIIHTTQREPGLRHFLQGGSRESKALKEKLIKMAAVLGIVTSRHGPYTTNVR